MTVVQTPDGRGYASLAVGGQGKKARGLERAASDGQLRLRWSHEVEVKTEPEVNLKVVLR